MREAFREIRKYRKDYSLRKFPRNPDETASFRRKPESSDAIGKDLPESIGSVLAEIMPGFRLSPE
jgi:hypothetical protein